MVRALVFALVMLLGTTAAWADDIADCNQSRNLDLRISGCSKLIKLNPKDAIAYKNRGVAYRKKGENGRAIADYSQAIKLNPKYTQAYRARAWAYFKWGKAAKALNDANKAIELEPKVAYIFNVRGHIYEALELKEAAIADYRKALELNRLDKDYLEDLKRLEGSPVKAKDTTADTTADAWLHKRQASTCDAHFREGVCRRKYVQCTDGKIEAIKWETPGGCYKRLQQCRVGCFISLEVIWKGTAEERQQRTRTLWEKRCTMLAPDGKRYPIDAEGCP